MANVGLSEIAGTTGAEAIVAVLESFGVEVVFGLCGHTNLAVLDALEHSTIRFISVRHEQVAAHAADGYFRSSGRLAGVLTTIGPGLANTVTALGDAALDGSAVVVICGNVPSSFIGRKGFQELDLHADGDQLSIVRPIVKRAWHVAHRDTLVECVTQACKTALADNPGPVVVDVPMDHFSARRPDRLGGRTSRRPSSTKRPADEAMVQAALELLTSAERPLIFAGGGSTRGDSIGGIADLAEYLGIPVVTTMSGQGVISKQHPLYAGYSAPVGTPAAHRLIHESDVVLVLGSRLAELETSSYNDEVGFAVPPTRIIQVDIDSVQIGGTYEVALGVIADARTFVVQLLDAVRSQGPRRPWESSPRYRELRADMDSWNEEFDAAALSDETPIRVERLLADIREALPAEGIFLTDVGIRHQVTQQFPVHSPRQHYVASGWGTMGGAVAAALGASVANPEVPVVAEVGDGAFSSVLSALVTAVEHDIAVVWVVMNNFGYRSINVYQAKHGLSDYGTLFGGTDSNSRLYNPDFAALARACGAEGTAITDPAHLLPVLKGAIAARRPWVLDVHTEHAPRTWASGFWEVNELLSGLRPKP